MNFQDVNRRPEQGKRISHREISSEDPEEGNDADSSMENSAHTNMNGSDNDTDCESK